MSRKIRANSWEEFDEHNEAFVRNPKKPKNNPQKQDNKNKKAKPRMPKKDMERK